MDNLNNKFGELDKFDELKDELIDKMDELLVKFDELDKLNNKFDELVELEYEFDELDKLILKFMSWIS